MTMSCVGAETTPCLYAAGLVQVQRADHTAVYSSNPGLPTGAFLALALAAGVHSYTPVVSSTTRVEAGGNMLVIHRKGATNTTRMLKTRLASFFNQKNKTTRCAPWLAMIARPPCLYSY